MSTEWHLVIRPKPGDTERPEFQWVHYGEVDLSLTLKAEYSISGRKTRFQLARFLDHPSAVTLLKQGEWDFDHALKITTEVGHYIDIRDDYYSPDELEKYFIRERLPLPEGYRAAFNFVKQRYNLGG